MKYTFRTIPLLLLTLAFAVFAEAPSDVTYTEGTLYYVLRGDSIAITGCFGRDAEVHVLAIIAGTPVNTIAAGAFTENTYVQTLYLPDTVSKVERGAIGDWIKVIYNANTDHPQETPTELILRNQDLEPETTAVPETSQPEETAPEAETTPAAEPSAEETSKPAETSGSAAETVPAASSAEQPSEDLPSETPQGIVIVLGIAAAAGAVAAVTLWISVRKRKK